MPVRVSLNIIENDFSVEMPYTDKYIELINKGKIVVNKNIIMVLKRIVRYKRTKFYNKKKKYSQSYHFNLKRSNALIYFADHNFSLSKGKNELLNLALVQKMWLENMFGWDKEYNKEIINVNLETKYIHKITRLVNHFIIIVPRGTGKSTFAMVVAVTNIICIGYENGSYGNDVYIVANTMKQGNIDKDIAKDLITLPETIPYKLNHTKEGGEPILKNTIYEMNNQLSRSNLKVLAPVYETLDGLNGSLSVFDEIHSYTNENLITVVTDGAARKRDEWLALYISTNGTLRDSVFDKKFKEWTDILKYDTNDNTLPFLYSLDEGDSIEDESVWQKAMPLLGITPTKDGVRKDLELAKHSESKMSQFLSKTMNIFTNPITRFFDDESYGNTEIFNNNLFEYGKGQFSSNRAIMGIDASKTNDFYSVSFMIKDYKSGVFNFKTLTFLPNISVNGQNSPYNKQERERFNEFAKNGELILHEYPENTTDYIYDQIIEFIEKNNINIMGIGYDMYQADTLVQKIKEYYFYRGNDLTTHGLYNNASLISKIQQAGAEMSTNFNSYKTLLVNKKIAFNNKLTSWAHTNVNTKNTNGYDKPSKDSNNKKIDPFAAQLDAYAEYKKHQIFYDNEIFNP